MSETQKSENSTFRLNKKGVAVVAGVSAVAGGGIGYGIHEAVDAASRIYTPETSVTAEANPIPIDIQELQDRMDALRKDGMNLHLIDTVTVQQGTSLYDEGLRIAKDLFTPEEFEENRANIQEVLLESGKTANTDQPDSPYVTHPGQVYGYYFTDVNDDGFKEIVTSLVPDTQLPTLSDENKD